MGCCSSYEEIYDSQMIVPAGVTCEQARDFLQKETTWKAINSPDGEIINHDDGSWTLQLDGRPPNTSGDSFLVYDTKTTGTAAAGDLALDYRGALTISPGVVDFAQTYEFREGRDGGGIEPASETGITIRRHVHDMQISGCLSCIGCCMPMAFPSSLKTEDDKIVKMLGELATNAKQNSDAEPHV